MFCGNGGRENPEGAAFCANCGQPLEDTSSGRSRRYKKVGIAALAALIGVAAVVLILIFTGGRRGAGETAEKFVTALFQGDGETMVELIPDGLLREMADEGDISLRQMKRQLAQQFCTRFEGVTDITEGMKVIATAQGERDFTRSDRRYILDYYDEMDVNVKDAKLVLVRFSIKAGGEALEPDDPVEVPVIRVGRSWYVDMTNVGNDFLVSLMGALWSGGLFGAA